MYLLTNSQTFFIRGGHTESSSPDDSSLNKYLIRDCIYGSLAVSLLCLPIGWRLAALGGVFGGLLGAGFGYLDWSVH